MKTWKTTAEQDAKAKINIRKYIQKHKNIVYTSDLPQVVTYRTLKQGTKYYNVLTGKATFERPTESNIVSVPSGYPINFGYTHYDAETNTVCCGIVTVDTATDKPNTNNKREYTFLSRFFMTGGTKAVYNENGEHIKEDSVPYTYTYRRGRVWTYTHNSVKAFWNFISARSHMRPITASNSSDKHQNYGISGILQYIKVNALEMDSECNRFYHIGEWSQKAVRTSAYADRIQKAIDYLTSQELPEIDVSFQAVPPRMETYQDSYDGHSYFRHNTGIIFIQNNENFVVFRYYNNRNYSYWGNNGWDSRWDGSTTQSVTQTDRFEQYRIYIYNERIYYCVFNKRYGKWEKDTHINALQYAPNAPVVNVDDIGKCDIFKYYESIIKTCNPTDVVKTLLSMMKHPLLESLSKIGCKNIVQVLLADNTINANIKHYVGKTSAKAKTPTQILGLNMYQIKSLEALLERTQNSQTPYYVKRAHACIMIFKELATMKRADNELFSVGYLSNTDTDRIIWALEALSTLSCCDSYSGRYSGRSYTKEYVPCYASFVPRYVQMSAEDKDKLFWKYIKLAQQSGDNKENNYATLRLIRDTISIYAMMYDNRPTINWDFNDRNEIINTHDQLVQLREIAAAERRRLNAMEEEERRKELEKRRQKVDERRQMLEYSNEKYSIILPKNLSEIVTEGNCLHHCVGGYTNRHATGETTIMFLRQNSNIDTPWYTVEVDNDRVIQIHGLHNRWLSATDDGYAAVPFIMEWLKKNNISCSDSILLSTSTGYANAGGMREMPKTK